MPESAVESVANIPVVSLAELMSDSGSGAIAELGKALEQFGFVAITDHGVDEGLLQRAFAVAERTFALPVEKKRAYEDVEGGRQRGYTSLGVEHAKDRLIGDLKEFWHVGRPQADMLTEFGDHRSLDLPRNLPPAEIAEFEPVFDGLFAELDRVATRLLAAIGRYLGYRRGFFEELTRGGNSVLRVIHYPPAGEEPFEPGAVRAAAHEDINLITVLPVSTAPGLQLQTRDGRWLDIATPPNVMVCDTGDMMQLLTDRRLPSTTHRVVNPEGAGAVDARYSMPFFCHPHPGAVLRQGGPEIPEILAHEFLMERLQDIGLA